jgi:CheY-like chemotaxis protein
MSDGSKLRFLVVDPLEGVQVFARRLLEGYGFSPDLIHCCGDSGEALAQGFVDPPDFLITDWFGKADITGVQLFEQLREQAPQCHVGFMSFNITPEIEAAAQAVGSRFLLKKPFTAELLKQTLQSTFEWMAKDRPELMARISVETKGKLDPRVVRRIELPPVPPPIRVGDAVQYGGKPFKVTAVVIRGGEQVAQLSGIQELVPAHKLQR